MDTFNILRSGVTPTVEIDVTQEDIERGMKMSCTQCPIALAVKRRTGLKDNVFVGPEEVYINDARYALPGKATTFVENFDRAQDVKPQKFVLTYDPETEEGEE